MAKAKGEAARQPAWKDWLDGARASALASLTEEERAERRALASEWRKQGSIRRGQLIDLARTIFAMHDDGFNAEEIASEVRRHPRWVRSFSAARGVTISRSPLVVRRAIALSVSHETTLRRLAQAENKSAAQTLAEFVALGLSDDARHARRFLRLSRKPAP